MKFSRWCLCDFSLLFSGKYNMKKFVYTYPLSTSYITRFLLIFSYDRKHISHTNGILKSPHFFWTNQIIECRYENRKDSRIFSCFQILFLVIERHRSTTLLMGRREKREVGNPSPPHPANGCGAYGATGVGVYCRHHQLRNKDTKFEFEIIEGNLLLFHVTNVIIVLSVIVTLLTNYLETA